MAKENRLWGAERIRGELLKLGIHVAKRTIQRYMRGARPAAPSRGQSWHGFLRNHTVWACDFLQTYDIWFRPIFAFFIVDVNTKRVVHVRVTRAPSQAWTAQQLRNAMPFDEGPQFIIRDRDDKFSAEFDRIAKGDSEPAPFTGLPQRMPTNANGRRKFAGRVVWLRGEDLKPARRIRAQRPGISPRRTRRRAGPDPTPKRKARMQCIRAGVEQAIRWTNPFLRLSIEEATRSPWRKTGNTCRPRGRLIACWCKRHSGCSNSSRVSFSVTALRSQRSSRARSLQASIFACCSAVTTF